MNKIGKNNLMVFIPFHILGIIGLGYALDNLWLLLSIWFLIGVIGNGVASHRYFAHQQFETYKPIRWTLGFLAVLGAIGPITHWRIQHLQHHAKSDTEEDPHSPITNSLFHATYGWMFDYNTKQFGDVYGNKSVKKIFVRMLKDDVYRFYHQYHYHILYSFCAILLLVDPRYLLIYCLAYCIDFIRLSLVNVVCHKWGYRNHDTKDYSKNNLIVGILGCGFGWHNNHHANPGKLVLTEKWWEIDIEGYIGFLLSKRLQ